MDETQDASADETRPGPPIGLIGQTISHYTILDKVGQGGMGVVYKARDLKLDRTVALKFLPATVQNDPELKRRLTLEARSASKLDHPNIVVIYDLDSMPDGTMFVAMAYHEGRTLQTRIHEGLTTAQSVDVARQMALGLAKAHANGIVHRDIKPSNVIVSSDGVTRIIDFGLAQPLDMTASVDGAIKGTPLYMSPEQTTGEPLDLRTDLWSLGVVLYEMLTGTHPFMGDTVAQVIRAVTSVEPPSVRTLRPDVPEALEAIVTNALKKDRNQRYQSADEMAADLSGVAATMTAPNLGATMVPRRHARFVVVSAVVLLAAVVSAGSWWFARYRKQEWARMSAPGEIQELQKRNKPLGAVLLAQEALEDLPGDPALTQTLKNLMGTGSVASTPAGATVQIADYLSPDGPWVTLGVTPIDKVQLPKGYLRWRISKNGVGTYEVARGASAAQTFPLDQAAAETDGKLPVPASTFRQDIGQIGWIGPYALPPFDIDKFEVTNKQFQAFVDAGGYTNDGYWTEPFVESGRTLSRADAMARFRDQTGRPGPSAWQSGHYPDGLAEYPVSGVSWYEAIAYAKFSNSALPVISQWFKAGQGRAQYAPQLSNLAGKGPARVGQFQGLGFFGTYDLAGNVREWCVNEVKGLAQRFILGGYWTAPSYITYYAEALPPFDRSAGNGFRTVRTRGLVPPEALEARARLGRDFAHLTPISNAVFNAYKAMYAYNKDRPLHTTAGETADTPDWRREKVTFDAAYGDERVPAYVFVPKRVKPPYQAVVFSPSANILFLKPSDGLGDMQFIDYVIQSGRAVIYPIYQDTYERRNLRELAMPGGADSREVVIQKTQDVSRAIDYLETRPDIDVHKVGYVGVSMGSAYGVFTGAVEPRVKAFVWIDGGFFLDTRPTDGIDQAEYAPRVTQPVLMLNGKYDFVFSPELQQEPMFNLLGTPPADKHHILFDTTHDDILSQRAGVVSAALGWFDKYLGRVGG